MSSIELNKLNKEKDIRFIVFNESQNFFTKNSPKTVEEFCQHLHTFYGIDYKYRFVKNILVDMSEDGYLKRYTSDKFLLNTL